MTRTKFEEMFAGRNGEDALRYAQSGEIHWRAKFKEQQYVWNAALSEGLNVIPFSVVEYRREFSKIEEAFEAIRETWL